MAIHFSVSSKKYTNQMIPFQFKFKKKDWLKIKYFSYSNSREKKRKFSVLFLFFIDHSILVIFVYLLLLFDPPLTPNQQQGRFSWCHITTTQTWVGDFAQNKQDLPCCSLVYVWVCLCACSRSFKQYFSHNKCCLLRLQTLCSMSSAQN